MSEFEQDYIMRQIKNLAGALAKLLFHKQSPSYTVTSEEHRTDADKLYLELGALLDEGRVNDAEKSALRADGSRLSRNPRGRNRLL